MLKYGFNAVNFVEKPFKNNQLSKTLIFDQKKELSLCHKFKFSNPYFFATWWCKPLIFHTLIIWSNRIHSLKCLRSSTLGYKDTGIKNQSLWQRLNFFIWVPLFIGHCNLCMKDHLKLRLQSLYVEIIPAVLNTYKFEIESFAQRSYLQIKINIKTIAYPIPLLFKKYLFTFFL